jgi:ATP-dependent DNA helicase DinG
MIEINGKKIYFPLKYKPNQLQLQALEFLKNSINTGKRISTMCLGTGTGKSYLTILFSTWYKNYINPDSRIDILTNSIVLTDQYIRDFDFIKNYKGQSNYNCDKFSTNCKIGRELCKVLKSPCDKCPYEIAKERWINTDIGILNFHLFSTLTFYQKDILKKRNSNVLIIDEGHLIESVISDFLSCAISAKILKKCGLTLKEIEILDDRFISKIKTIDKYLDFLERKLIPTLEEKLNKFELEIKKMSGKNRIEITNFVQSIESKLLSFKQLFESHKKDPSNIVLDIEIDKKDKMYSGIKLISQHIWIGDYLNEYIYKHYDHVIFMTATIGLRDVFSFVNGLDPKLTSYLEIETPFKLENRPIYYIKGIGRMNLSSKEETFKKQIVWINKILKKYENKKGIIHCTTYEISNWIKENIQNERLLFHDPENKDEILEKHLQNSEPTVIVSPSMSNGIDLKDNNARFSIILKIPYPTLGSKKIVSRKNSNKDYYSNATISELLQMVGRGVRNDDDYCDTFILDSNFSDLLKYNSHMIPKYFTDAIKILKI